MADWYDKTEKMIAKILAETTEINSKLKSGNHQNPEDVVYNNQQFMKLMDISKRTAQDWRDKKVIHFIQIGNKIYYRLSDVQKLLNDNYNPKK
jgi:predicted lipase